MRKDIALQLHGSVQNTVVLLMHRLKDLEQAAPPELAAELADLQNDYGEALADHIRSITHRLYPSILRYGLVPALQSLTDTFQETLDVELELDEAFVRLEKEDHGLIPEQVRLAAYRIAEEAFGNTWSNTPTQAASQYDRSSSQGGGSVSRCGTTARVSRLGTPRSGSG